MSSEPGSARPAVVTVDGQGWFLSVSSGFLELIGSPVERLSGSNLVDHLHPDDAASARQLLASAASGSAPVALLVEVFDATGEWAPAELCFEAGSGDRLTFRFRETFDGGNAAVSPMVTPPDPAAEAAVADEPSRRDEPPRDEFPYDESPEHLAYVASIPGDDIVDRRVAARAAAGTVDTPMLEIDAEGRTVYVSGSWSDLGDDGATGVDVFEQLLEQSGSADPVLQAIDNACRRSEHGRHPLQIAGGAPRWISVTPIPSSQLASETNALVSIVTESQLNDPTE